jgi:hypothetical protein
LENVIEKNNVVIKKEEIVDGLEEKLEMENVKKKEYVLQEELEDVI